MAGIGVHDDRNRCSPSVGIGVHLRPEWVFMMGRITQSRPRSGDRWVSDDFLGGYGRLAVFVLWFGLAFALPGSKIVRWLGGMLLAILLAAVGTAMSGRGPTSNEPHASQ